MELTVLGRFGPYPRAGGACSGYLVSEGDTTVLVDCGAGVLSRLVAEIPLSQLDAIVLSHLHYDHCADMSVLRYALEQLAARDGVRSPMPVYAPDAPKQAQALFDYPVFDIHTVTDGMRLAIGQLTFTFFSVQHPAPAFGMNVVSAEGRRLTYTGDTGYFDGLVPLCCGADAILADCCFLDADDTGEPMMHMTARQAGNLVRQAHGGRLLCTHLWGGTDTEETVKKEVDSPCATVVQELGHYMI